MRRARLAAAVLVTAVVLAGCSTAAPAPPPPTGPAPQDPAVFEPLVITPLDQPPAPVRGTDGRYHLVYELQVLNAGPRAATLTSVDSLADGPGGRVVGSVAGPEVTARSLLVGDYTLPPVPVAEVPGGRTILLILEDVYDTPEAVPVATVHRVRATYGPLPPGQATFAGNFPTTSEQVTRQPVRADGRPPTVIGPPLSGPDWVAVNACCELSPHRGAMVPLDGRINGGERYAVDWSRFDLTARPIVDLTAGTQATFRGDPTRNEDYLTFDQPVLAVGDATVVAVVGDLPEAPPHQFLTLPVNDLGGNRVVLDLGNGVYAFYAHLRTGSPEVRVGDRVRRGQEIARTGNSGNTSESHLHFGLMDSPQPLTATNLPWVIDSLTYVGTVTPETVLTQPPPGPRSGELPLIYSAVDFPPVPPSS
ncbi:M23 family metallopeptidase [Actinomycetospora termitidis]|uniref:M23 family metallopeptidase n=1 Tax=Actinomycetospora termitidis TaxID=3053470 RepID=A0ABT7MCD1_9PSEU|nr:M23 family metallopeptidase [Actinomycetospora sp. Odt1-22]MDL5158320.1 M23 family metallopeptidase [Actinomycetospora sp. Odt1-22]